MKNDTATPSAIDARAARYSGRHALRSITTVMRCYDCGREPTGVGVGVRRTAEAVVGFVGLVSCGRVWLCPVCNAKVMARRAVEIGAALTWAAVEGHHVIWGSLTCWHNAYSDLAELLELQRTAWRTVVSDRRWRDRSSTRTVTHEHAATCEAGCERKRESILTSAPGRVGYIRAAELNIGRNGWHPHFHPLIIVQGDRELAEAIASDVVGMWVEGVEAAGGEAVRDGGQQLRVVSGLEVFDALTGYVTKATYDGARLALEAVWSQGKIGRGRVKETVSHWSLLASIEQGLADETSRWWQLEEATPGHRMITWSRGLRSFAGLTVDEITDEELAAEVVGDAHDTVCFITPEGWLAIRDLPDLLAQILRVLEVGGWAALRPLLDAHKIEYLTLDFANVD